MYRKKTFSTLDKDNNSNLLAFYPQQGTSSFPQRLYIYIQFPSQPNIITKVLLFFMLYQFIYLHV